MSTIQIDSDYYVYTVTTNPSPAVKYCKVITSSGTFEGNTCSEVDQAQLVLSNVTNATKIVTTNLNGQPYLYAFGDVAGQVSICSISTITDPNINKGELSSCSIFDLPGSITTMVGSMAFGSF